MTKITLHDHYEFVSVARIYEITDQFCTARVSVHAMVDQECDVDINDVEVEWYINGQRTIYSGFKKLYEELFGINSYKKYSESVCSAAEDATYSYYQTLKSGAK